MAPTETIRCQDCHKIVEVTDHTICSACTQVLCLDCFIESNCPDGPATGHVHEELP